MDKEEFESLSERIIHLDNKLKQIYENLQSQNNFLNEEKLENGMNFGSIFWILLIVICAGFFSINKKIETVGTKLEVLQKTTSDLEFNLQKLPYYK